MYTELDEREGGRERDGRRRGREGEEEQMMRRVRKREQQGVECWMREMEGEGGMEEGEGGREMGKGREDRLSTKRGRVK